MILLLRIPLFYLYYIDVYNNGLTFRSLISISFIYYNPFFFLLYSIFLHFLINLSLCFCPLTAWRHPVLTLCYRGWSYCLPALAQDMTWLANSWQQVACRTPQIFILIKRNMRNCSFVSRGYVFSTIVINYEMRWIL